MNQEDNCSVQGCTNEGKPEPMGTMTLILCRPCVWDLSAHQHQRAREVVAEIEEQGLLLGPTKGWTYVIRVGNSNVKIGKGGTKSKPLHERLQNLSLSHADNKGVPVQVLAVLPGGTSTELLAHRQWQHLRVPGQMEEFYADPSLLRWAESQGIHSSAEEAVEAFTDWQVMRHLSPKKNGATAQLTRLGIETGYDDKDWEF